MIFCLKGEFRMKKFGKIVAFIGVAGAALAGLWYFLDNVKDCEGCCQDSDEDEEKKDEERSYVSLDPEEKEEDKEALKKAVTDAVKETQAKAEEAAEGLGVVAEDIAKKADEFEFKSFDESKEDEE